MKIYEVGGCIRDSLLGLTPNDIDYVVTGSNPKEMLSLGYTCVGASFPVFLHPETKDEYALARTEASTGDKYQDFDCYFGEDVTIEEDLLRRDLTINSLAQDIETGELIDPYDGVKDITNKVLRPVSTSFKDDPVRVLRAARFNARFPDFTYSVGLELMCDGMYREGMLEGLTPERVWKEMEKALQTKKPSIFFERLFKYNLFQEITDMWGCPQNTTHHPEVEYTKYELGI